MDTSKAWNIFKHPILGILGLVALYGACTRFLNQEGVDVARIINLPAKLVEQRASTQHETTYVAVVDTGFDLYHPAYRKNVSKRYRYSTDRSNDIREIPSYQNGRYQLTHHGTHVVGILCGLLGKRDDGSYAFAGVAPHAKVILTQVLPYASNTEIAQAFEYLEQTPAKVVSISMSFAKPDQPMPSEILHALLKLANSGKIIVMAAGNTGVPLGYNRYSDSLLHLAKLARGRVILVGASEWSSLDSSFWAYISQKLPIFPNCLRGDSLASFSARPYSSSAGQHFICAPGVRVRSSVTSILWDTQVMSGTSMAAPIVTGSLACILLSTPDIDEAAEQLFQHARTTNLITKEPLSMEFGQGIVDLSFLVLSQN